jgi:hypothetical protein
METMETGENSNPRTPGVGRTRLGMLRHGQLPTRTMGNVPEHQ